MKRTERLYEYRREILGAIFVLVLRILTMPRTFWESDELLFAAGIKDFDPWSSHPHPPGYPLLIGLGKFLDFFFDDPFRSLVALSIIASVVAFFFLARAFDRIIGDRTLAVCGALIFSCAATVLVHGPLPFSDLPAMALVAIAFYAATYFPNEVSERIAIVLGLAISAAIGTRPQLLVPLLPLLALLLLWTRDVRKIVAGLLAFTFLSIAWFGPLMDAAGGFEKLVLWETRQAAYVAAHDAQLSRGASDAGGVVTRFLFHPWGPKFIALPMLLLAFIGLVALRRRPKALLVPIVLFGVIQLVFEVLSMDPADAPRYSIPLVAVMSLFIAAALGSVRDSARMHSVPYVLTAVIAGVSILYTLPILAERTKHPSPPAAAAAYANASLPPNAIVLYDLSLRPAAEYLVRRTTMPIEKGLEQFYDRPDVPLVLFADGGSHVGEAKTFSWRDSDAYGKLTRNHYRQVTLDPVRPEERYLPLRGVYAMERTIDGDEWRWLSNDAAFRLPTKHATAATLTLRLSPDTPYDANPIHIAVNGNDVATITVTKSATQVTFAIPSGNVDITIRSERSFRPADALHNQDPRVLGVQLLAVRG